MVSPLTKGQVLGLGGLFFRSPDPARLRDWYQRALGLQFNSWGGVVFPAADLPAASWSVFTALAAGTDYFGSGTQPFMVNLIVDDLEAIIARAAAAGATVLAERTSGEHGEFAWIIDCDGNRVELWQPPSTGGP